MTLHAVPLRSVPAVVVSGLRRSYGARHVIDRLDLRIDRGGLSHVGRSRLLRGAAAQGIVRQDGGK